MANFLLQLRENAALANEVLKQFAKPNETFFCDNFWKLYQVRWNPNKNTIAKLKMVLESTKKDLPSRLILTHVRELSRVGSA